MSTKNSIIKNKIILNYICQKLKTKFCIFIENPRNKNISKKYTEVLRLSLWSTLIIYFET